MAQVEEWAEGHDKVCGDRYRLLLTAIGFGATLLTGVAGWSLNQLYDGQKAQLAALQSLSAQISQQPHAPVTVQMNQRP